MNANELADKLLQNNAVSWGNCTPEDYDTAVWTNEQAATMLRQQQAEIAELKHINKNWQISENILLLELEKLQHCELTDEEIDKVLFEISGIEPAPNSVLEFARAILRKASEK